MADPLNLAVHMEHVRAYHASPNHFNWLCWIEHAWYGFGKPGKDGKRNEHWFGREIAPYRQCGPLYTWGMFAAVCFVPPVVLTAVLHGLFG